MSTPTLDETRATAFAQRMTGTLNDAFLAFMVSIGHQTGLFDAMARLPPATSDEIARAAGLQERYVREWLGAMVTGRIVGYDPVQRTYVLPAEHAACLTRAAGASNLATSMLWVSCIGAVEPEVVECFRRSGGVPYAAYGRFSSPQTVPSPSPSKAVMKLAEAGFVEVTVHTLPGDIANNYYVAHGG